MSTTDTDIQRIAEEVRQKCNKLTKEARASLMEYFWSHYAQPTGDVQRITPRTDANLRPETGHLGDYVLAEFARRLERELSLNKRANANQVSFEFLRTDLDVQYRLASYNGVKLDEIATTLRPLCYDANFVRRWGTRCDTNDEIDELHSSYAGYLRQTVMENTLAMQQECADH